MTKSDDVDLRSRGDLAKERKAEENKLAALAQALVSLTPRQLSKLELDEEVSDAISEARRMTTHAARARQLRAVRRELRACDSAAIADALQELLDPRRPAAPPAPDEALRWVERFLDEGKEAVEQFLAVHGHADRQKLQRLTREMRHRDAKKASKARKALVSTVRADIAELSSST